MQPSLWLQRAAGGIGVRSTPLACHATASLRKIPANAGAPCVSKTRRGQPRVDPLWHTTAGTGHLLDRRRELEIGRRGIMSCPIAYRTGAHLLASSAKDIEASTAFIIGGMYGNPFALSAILERASEEEAGAGGGGVGKPLMVFNGDFNFFNCTPRVPIELSKLHVRSDFAGINERIMSIPGVVATAGNVEFEVAHSLGEAGCGCGYPPYVDPGVVTRSDEIVAALGKIASTSPRATAEWLKALPLYAVLSVGGCRMAVVHGDPDGLAGWGLAAEMVQPLDQHLRESLGVPPSEFTACETTHKWFADASVTAFACTHTCMAYAQGFPAEKGLGNRAVFNNGSSGMPNFQGGKCGVITRVSSDLTPPRDSLYGCTLGGPTPGSEVRIDAIPVNYDHSAFWDWFQGVWPEGSPAFASYAGRIKRGVNGYTVAQADRLASVR